MPFPFVEQPRLRLRPSLIVAVPPSPIEAPVVWTMMITSVANAGWPGDVSLEKRYPECGLPHPSVIRTVKIATTEARLAQPIGRLPQDLWDEVLQLIRCHFEF